MSDFTDAQLSALRELYCRPDRQHVPSDVFRELERAGFAKMNCGQHGRPLTSAGFRAVTTIIKSGNWPPEA